MSYDWDALAPVWHLFEDRGFAAPHVGRYAARLRDRLGDVVALDGSRAMARRGIAIHRLRYVVADARALPFADRSFASALCTTGIIEGLSCEVRAAVLRELARVARRGAYLAAFVRRGPGHEIDLHQLVRSWERGDTANALFESVAGATGDRTLASTLLQLSLPAIEPAVDEREVLDAAGDADVSVLRLAHDESRGVMLWRLRR